MSIADAGGGAWFADPAEVLRNRLFDRRIVVVSGHLDHGAATRAATEIMTLDAAGDEAIGLQVECPSADLDAAMALMDVIELCGVPVRASALGLVGGPGVGVVALSHHRTAMPHTRWHLCECMSTFDGHARDVERFAEDRRDRWWDFCVRVSLATHRATSTVADDFGAGRFLGSEDALGYGLIDEVLRPGARLVGPADRSMGFGPSR